MSEKMDRRAFLSATLAAAAGAALLLAGCGTPAVDAPAEPSAVDRTQDQEDIQIQPAARTVEENWGVGCPAGLVNDPYPGRCKHYIDRNGNGVCDRSEPGSGDYPPRT